MITSEAVDMVYIYVTATSEYGDDTSVAHVSLSLKECINAMKNDIYMKYGQIEIWGRASEYTNTMTRLHAYKAKDIDFEKEEFLK